MDLKALPFYIVLNENGIRFIHKEVAVEEKVERPIDQYSEILNDMIWGASVLTSQPPEVRMCTEIILQTIRKAERKIKKKEELNRISAEMKFYKDQYKKQQEIIRKLQGEIDFKSQGLTEVSNTMLNPQEKTEKPKFGDEEKVVFPEELDFWNTKIGDEKQSENTPISFAEIAASSGLYISGADTEISIKIPEPTPTSSDIWIPSESKKKLNKLPPPLAAPGQARNFQMQRELHQKKLRARQPLGKDGKPLPIPDQGSTVRKSASTKSITLPKIKNSSATLRSSRNSEKNRFR